MRIPVIAILLLLFSCVRVSAQNDSIRKTQYTVLDGVYMGKQIFPREELQDFSANQEIFIEDTLTFLKIKKLPRLFRPIKNEMALFTGADFTAGNSQLYRPATYDSTLLFKSNYQPTRVEPFLLAEFEITNGEYREFFEAVFDSLKRDLLFHAEIDGYATPRNDNPQLPGDQKGYTINYSTPIDMTSEDVYDAIWDVLYLQGFDRFYNRKEYDVRKFKYRYYEDSVETIINIYPDTTVWRNNPAVKMLEEVYFWHPAYSNFPVVGVSYDQALAYCHWKTKELKSQLAYFPELAKLIHGYRLPTRFEWEYATKVLPSIYWYTEESKVQKRFQHLNSLSPERVNLRCIEDINGFQSPLHCFDAYETTCEVNDMYSDMRSVYHLKGNVAEWTCSDVKSDTIPSNLEIKNNFNSIYLNETNFPITASDNLVSIQEKLKNSNPPLKYINQEKELDSLQTITAQILLHDYQVLSKGENLKYVCGGSWKNNPVYTELPQAFPSSACDSSIGFRLVLDIEPEAVPYFLEKDYLELYLAAREKSKQ